MSRETIDKVMSGTYREEDMAAGGNGVGMDNVISRMRLFTGNEDVMTIRSEGRGTGTEVSLCLTNEESHGKAGMERK